jgi:uncharacterized protein (DUF302 family)
MSMYDRPYATTRRIDGSTVAAVVPRVRAALAAEGFGVLTEIDVQATFKNKLGVEHRPYLILGACNPSLAYRALASDPGVGVFLPCNVTLFEGEDGATYVQAFRPAGMFAAVRASDLQPIADEVAARLERAVAAM